ncbi:YqgE/AlgH family protein [Acidocella sp. KAb 2-4]|uniref:YqgE/AlgH family protein n=1 Tax=Acidocella sp. KAb 2-4 TaxID=2885158 RepID=UPI001D08295E|nr:YqgE/AlgH family protein [Acidocella sp. KAb 2-4]MCB5945020.1 YqgE/AlgH family protein [Acidocella sp. KAb 2-4]
MADAKHSRADTPDWLTGQLLIAMPAMEDPRFVQSVIYVCSHNGEGAMGVVLNRPLRAPKFSDLMHQLGVEPSPPQRELALGTGGPVDETRGFVLHSADWLCDTSLRVDADRALSASLDILQAVAAGGGPAQARLLLGYAGWGAGQLDAEMRQNVWLSTTADDALIFDTAYTTKWQRALGKLGIDPGMLSGAAGRA